MSEDNRSIFEQIGGAAAVEAAVDIFYKKVIADNRVNYWFEGMDMQAQRKKQTIFLTQALGGPSSYSGRDMAAAHLKLVEKGLNDSHFDAIVDNLVQTLQELNVPSHLIEQIGKKIETLRDSVLCRNLHSSHQSKGDSVSHSEPTQLPMKSGVWLKTKLLNRELLVDGRNDKVIKLTFELPHNSFLGFHPGQHVVIGTTLEGKWIQREYTPVSDAKELNQFQIVVKVYPDGRVSKFLDEISIGTAIEFSGPKGHYLPHLDNNKDIILLAAGSGITTCWQFFLAAKSQSIQPKSLHLLYSTRFEDEIIFQEQLEEMRNLIQHIPVTIHYTITKPTEKWSGLKGRICDSIWKENLPSFNSQSRVCICGEDQFNISMKRLAQSYQYSDEFITIL